MQYQKIIKLKIIQNFLTGIPVSYVLVGGDFFRADHIQHQGMIEHHASIDQSQIQHERLQLLFIHLNQILQIAILRGINLTRK